MSVDLNTVKIIMAETKTFRGQSINVDSIYNLHPEEKCFRVGIDNEVSTYKVRFPAVLNKLSLATEYETCRVLRQQGFKWAPEIYEFQAEEPAYLITEYKEGESLDKSLNWTSHAATIGVGLNRLLAEIHQIQGDYFGHLAGPRYSSWHSFFDIRFQKHIRNVVAAGAIDENNLREIETLYDEATQALRQVNPSLLHGDVKPANIVFDSNRCETHLVDFELARFGDVDFEWVKLHYLSRRWQEYLRLVAAPLLDSINFTGRLREGNEAKLLIYSLYHVCSALGFEHKLGLPIPDYRFVELAEIFKAIRLRGTESPEMPAN